MIDEKLAAFETRKREELGLPPKVKEQDKEENSTQLATSVSAVA